ncbi:MAG: hypothetical protein LQ351_002328 [Letrouitia transgressa]|nr:MAG: hypothetical protein LQ351_002328 [Letrouitia transgressa]
MEHRKPPEYVLEVLGGPSSIKDIVKGVLHTIFFHRFFPSIRPSSLEVLDLTLPLVCDQELETLIDTRVGQLIRQLSSTSSPKEGSRGEMGIRFYEKRRRKSGGLGGWLTGTGKSEEEICWEAWKLVITLTAPRTEAGRLFEISIQRSLLSCFLERMTMTKTEAPALQRTAMNIVKIVNRDKDHIPPITTSETNPFPYEIILSPRAERDGRNLGFF